MFRADVGEPGSAALERELAGALSPVRAPEVLWRRVERRSRGTAPRIAMAAACLLIAAWISWSRSPSLEELAVSAHDELVRHPDSLQIRTEDAAELTRWLVANAPFVPAAAWEPIRTDEVRLAGARVTSRGGRRLAVVSYRSADGAVTLIATGARAGSDTRREPAPKTAGTLATFSWELPQGEFALVSAAPGDARRACALCHSRGDTRVAGA